MRITNPATKAAIRRWVPPGVREIYNRVSGNAIYFDGVYKDWNSARNAADGYASEYLFERVESAALAAQAGNAPWEQDEVLMYDKVTNFPLLASLLSAAVETNGDLVVLDFGGALGSTYRQVRPHLAHLTSLKWNVVEQAHVVTSGKRHFENDQLSFYASIEECLNESAPIVALLSASLQYVEGPEVVLARIRNAKVPNIVLDRHPVTITEQLITVQKLPSSIYAGSYPCWLFDSGMSQLVLGAEYRRNLQWIGNDPPIFGRGIGAKYVGELWKLGQMR